MPQRSAVRDRVLVALAGLGILTGYLLTSGAAAPLLADVLDRLSPADAAPASPAQAGSTVNGQPVALSGATTDWMNNDHRPEWGSDRLVPQSPAGSDAVQAPQPPLGPEVQVPENPRGRALFTWGAPMPRVSLKGPSDCPQPSGPGMNAARFTAVPSSAGAATVSWWDLNDPNVRSYEVQARLVRPAPTADGSPPPTPSPADLMKIQTVSPPRACTGVSVSFPGLISGAAYQFMLSEIAVAPEQGNRTYRIGRGQASIISIA